CDALNTSFGHLRSHAESRSTRKLNRRPKRTHPHLIVSELIAKCKSYLHLKKVVHTIGTAGIRDSSSLFSSCFSFLFFEFVVCSPWLSSPPPLLDSAPFFLLFSSSLASPSRNQIQ